MEISIEDYTEIAQNKPLKYGLDFINKHKKEIEKIYENAYFEFKINLLTRNQNELTINELKELEQDMNYFLTKKKRYISDSAIVYNYLSSTDTKCLKNTELFKKLEIYLFKVPSRFSFMYIFTGFLNFTDNEKLELGEQIIKNFYNNVSKQEQYAFSLYFRDFGKINPNDDIFIQNNAKILTKLEHLIL